MPEPTQKSLIERLKDALAHHESKAAKIAEAIEYVKKHPEFEEFYDVVKRLRE